MGDEPQTIRITSYSQSMVQLEGMTKEESEFIQGSLRMGAHWIRVIDGKLEHAPGWQQPPSPTQDEKMLPFWRDAEPKTVLRDSDRLLEHASFHLSIQHLCGYAYTPENYRREAARLESYGFECMRSRRGDNGQYWEIWYLPGFFCAKGALAAEIAGERNQLKCLDLALTFLSRNVQFGSLDASVQRLAMVME